MKPIALRTLTIFAAALVAVGIGSTTIAAETPKVGDKAPLVTGKDQDGKTWELGKLIGKKNVLLYFYPKDNTTGCTREACAYRDQIEDLKKDNVEVVGVSFDSGESHLEFISKHKLNFPLLADTDGKIADAYAARNASGKAARRVSFLIGLDGTIAHVTDNPSADVHISETKEAIGKLKKS
jgi:thioredoxin-dependent peroxiredoxin